MGRIVEITDFSAPELDVYARLTENQLVNREYPERGMFICESPLVIRRALDAGVEPVSFLAESRESAAAVEMAGDRENVPVYTAEFDILTKLTGFKLTRGMLCAMKRPVLSSPEQVCRGARRVAVLEDVVNPTNVGAIFRSAAALNMDGVLLTPACSDPLYRRAIRVSMGTVFQIPWAWIDDFGALKTLGFKTAAMALKDDTMDIADPALKEEAKLAVVLGTEGEGLREETIRQCDYTVKIPMSHGVDSLNVAAASAVAFYQLGR